MRLFSLMVLTASIVLGISTPRGLAQPKEGDAIPPLEVLATKADKAVSTAKDGKFNLKDLKGKKVVLFYFPKAMTRGCTIESCGFRDMIEAFEKENTVVIGFSADKLSAQEQFTEKEKLNFPLIADSEKKLMTALGVKGRTTWIFDSEGKLAKVITKVSVQGHPKECLEVVKGLK